MRFMMIVIPKGYETAAPPLAGLHDLIDSNRTT